MSALSTGIFHTSYASELRLRHTRPERVRLALGLALLLALPFALDDYWLSVLNGIGIACIGALGLNLLVGFTGQISLGHAGFMAVGAFTSALLSTRAGVPMPLAVLAAVLLSAALGVVVGLPALRLEGVYLAIATLASQEIIEFIVRRWSWLTAGQGFLDVPGLWLLAPHASRTTFERCWYAVILCLGLLSVAGARNLLRSALGRSLLAVRDHDVAASAIGVDVARAKLTAFALSSALAGLVGALSAHYSQIVSWERFTLETSVQYLGMIIVGGLGSVAGSVYGAAFVCLFPPLLAEAAGRLSGSSSALGAALPALQLLLFGALIVLFLSFEPRGLERLWRRAKDYCECWPYRY
jgi:branched-chain amino acid transport system permease protein